MRDTEKEVDPVREKGSAEDGGVETRSGGRRGLGVVRQKMLRARQAQRHNSHKS